VTYTATVKTQAPSPLAPVTAGTVTFFDNSIQIGSPVPVNSSGIASTPPVTYTTQLGTHTITAIYNPPTVAPINYAASAMVSLTQVVLKASGINVAPVAGNLYGQNLVYNVTFNTVPVGGTLTGTVVVTENGNPVSSGGGTLVSASSAVITIPGGALSQGSHNLVFTFTDTLGPPAYAPSSKSITQSVGAATSQVVFTPPLPTSILYGNTVDYSGVINTTTPNSRNPNAGTVKLFLDSTVGTPLATQAVSLTQELQELTIGGGTGTFTLTYNGFTTVALAWDVPPTGGTLPEDSLQNALNALPSIGGLGGSVNVSGTAGVSYLVEFGGSLAGVNVSQMSAASSDGANPSVSTLAPGSAGFSFTGVSLPATVTTGAHTIIAAFVPANSNHSASQASSPLSISKAGTTTAIVSSSTLVGPATYQSTYGDLVTFTATVTSSTTGSPAFGPASYSNATTTGVPLNFYIGNTLIAGTVTRTGTTANSATYALTTSSLKALLPPLFTPHTVKAFYRGNASFLATPTPQDTMQPSSVLFQIVDKASTSVALSSSAPGGSYVGKSVTFTAIVTSASGGTPTTSGATMKFYKDNGATFMGNGVLSSTTANSATYKFTTSTSALPPNAGGHQIVATYSGAANFLGSSNSPAFSQVVNKAVTTMTITSSPAVWATNSNTTFTITIKLAQGAAAINPGATVTLDDNGNGLPGVATWTAGTATTATYKYTMTTPFTPGAHTITAIYSGNANVEANSVSKSQADVRLLSRLSLVALGTPTAGQNVTFSATLTSLTGPVAGRAVTFTINGNTYTATTNASGVATVTGKFFTSGGTYPVSAAFTDPILNDAFASASVYVKPPTIGRLA
jgi:hypothetical protein